MDTMSVVPKGVYMFLCWSEEECEEDGYEVAAYDAECAASFYYESLARGGEARGGLIVFVKTLDHKGEPIVEKYLCKVVMEPSYMATKIRESTTEVPT